MHSLTHYSWLASIILYAPFPATTTSEVDEEEEGRKVETISLEQQKYSDTWKNVIYTLISKFPHFFRSALPTRWMDGWMDGAGGAPTTSTTTSTTTSSSSIEFFKPIDKCLVYLHKLHTIFVKSSPAPLQHNKLSLYRQKPLHSTCPHESQSAH